MQSILALLQTVIYAISSCLLYPVMIALIALTAWLIIFAGAFFAEWVTRKRISAGIDIAEHLATIREQASLPDDVAAHLPVHVRNYATKLTALVEKRDAFFHEKVENLIQEKELKLAKEVDRIRLVVRVGPSLGLMGTLIPMGTGLAALSQGDLTQMASSLIIAFTTTVVGLALGIVAYIFATVKGRWVQDDIRKIELIAEAMTGGKA